jgi:hypothetical protein
MSVALATTFYPRGETGRLQRLYPQLQAAYSSIVISLSSDTQPQDVEIVQALPGVQAFVNRHWSQGRYRALKKSLDNDWTHLHYADMDRLLRWVETRPNEWRQTVIRIEQSDCLVIGRTAQAWNTHPQAMRETEAISNQIFSRLLGQSLDLSAGSKGFSRRAVEFLIANTQPGRAIGTDAEWIVLLHRAGFRLESLQVDGLDWEIPDQYQDTASDGNRQQAMAESYDADAEKWKYRVAILREIVEAGLDAVERELV